MRSATGHAFAALPQAQAVALGGGASIFLFGEALFRRTLAIGADRGRALTALIALATIPIGTQSSAALQLLVLVALFSAMLLSEARFAARAEPRQTLPPRPPDPQTSPAPPGG